MYTMYIYMDSFEFPNYPVKRIAMQKKKKKEKSLFSPYLLIENNPSEAWV